MESPAHKSAIGPELWRHPWHGVDHKVEVIIATVLHAHNRCHRLEDCFCAADLIVLAAHFSRQIQPPSVGAGEAIRVEENLLTIKDVFNRTQRSGVAVNTSHSCCILRGLNTCAAKRQGDLIVSPPLVNATVAVGMTEDVGVRTCGRIRIDRAVRPRE